MATLVAPKAAASVAARHIHAGVISVVATYTATAALSAGDVIQMVKVPAGATIVGIEVAQGAYKAYTFTVGDGGSTARYLGATSGSPTLVITRNTAITSANYTYTADDTIDIVTTAVSSASVSSAVVMRVNYTMDGV